VRTLHRTGLAPALLIASGLLAFGCGSRTGFDELAAGGIGSSGSSGGVATMGCGEGNGTPVVLATTGPNQVMNLAVGATSLYWVDESGAVMKMSKCGGSATTIASAGPFYGSSSGGSMGFAVDSSRVYVAGSAGDLFTVPLSGGAPTTLATTNNVLGLAVSGGDLYWVADGPSLVGSVPVQGGAPVTLAMAPPIAQGTPAADDSSIYWVGNGVFSTPRAGGAVTTLAVAQQPSTGLAIDDANVYWCANSSQTSTIMSTPKTGGPSVTLVSEQTGATQFATDGKNVYWANPLSTAVMKVPVAGGSPVTVAVVSDPGAIALDDTSVYFAQFTGSGTGPGASSVMKLSPK
jgi:hypothetical protein